MSLNLGIEVDILEKDNFLIIRESLTRMGIASYKKHTLTQSCHVYHSQGKYSICHFKELFVLDGKEKVELSEDDLNRRLMVAQILESWGLLKITDERYKNLEQVTVPLSIIKFGEKEDWELKSKFTLGKKDY